MTKTNTKKVNQALTNYILECWNNHAADYSMEQTMDFKKACKSILDIYMVEKFDNKLDYSTFKSWCICSEFFSNEAMYYCDTRSFLKILLEETEEESDKYTNEEVLNLYVHLIIRTLNGGLRK